MGRKLSPSGLRVAADNQIALVYALPERLGQRQDVLAITNDVPIIMTRLESRMKTPSTSLVHVLIGKSIVETLLVGALAVFTFITVLPPYFHGWGEVTETGISGWAVNNASPWDRVEVQLFVDGKFQATTSASEPRPDVALAGWAKDQWHGYSFPLTSLTIGYHEARVYALHNSGRGTRKSLQLLGDPIPVVVDSNGKIVPRSRMVFRVPSQELKDQ